MKECTTLKRRLQDRVPNPSSPPDASRDSNVEAAASDDGAVSGGGGSKRDSIKTVSGKDSVSSSSDISVASSPVVKVEKEGGAKSEKEKCEKDGGDEKDTDELEAQSRLSGNLEAEQALGSLSPLAAVPGKGGKSGDSAISQDENANSSETLPSPQTTQLQQQLEAAQKTIETQT